MYSDRNKRLDVNKAERNFKKTLEETPLEKGDLPALIVAGFIVGIPVVIISGGIVYFVFHLLFG